MNVYKDGVGSWGSAVPETATRSVVVIGFCFLISVFVAVLYFNSLGNQFTIWDDGMIYSGTAVRSLSLENILSIFTLKKAATYQPVRVLSYAVDYYFWKLNPVGYHITNIFFYIITCIMVYFALFHLSMNLRERAFPDSHSRVAFLGSLLFAAHPVHVEAVAWLAARKEVLQGSFFFLAFFLYLKAGEVARRRTPYLSMVFLFILLAILSKPSAVVFPGVIIVYEIARRKEDLIDFFRRHWIFLLASLVLSGIFISIMMKVMFEAGGIKPYRGGSLLNNLLVSCYSFLYNIKLLVSTVNYSAAYTIPIPNPILTIKTFIFVGLTFLLFALSFWTLKFTKVIFFSFLFFFVTLLPYLNIIPISTLLADRYVFIASFAYAFVLGIAFDHLYAFQHQKFSKGFFKLLCIVLFLFLLGGYSFMTVRQNTIWENSYTLWEDAVEKYPDSNTANALMGVVYMDIGMDDKAVKYLERAVEITPYDYQSRNNLGIVYGRLNEPEKALKELMTAIQLMPDDDSIKINLSVFYQKQKEYKKAEQVLSYLLSKDTKSPQLHFRLGVVYKDAGQYEKAISEMLKVIELAPNIINPYIELGDIYGTRMNDLEKAKYYYMKGIEAAPKAKSKVQDLRWMVGDLER